MSAKSRAYKRLITIREKTTDMPTRRMVNLMLLLGEKSGLFKNTELCWKPMETAQRLGVHINTLNRYVNTLEKHGWLKRIRLSKHDPRYNANRYGARIQYAVRLQPYKVSIPHNLILRD